MSNRIDRIIVVFDKKNPEAK